MLVRNFKIGLSVLHNADNTLFLALRQANLELLLKLPLVDYYEAFLIHIVCVLRHYFVDVRVTAQLFILHFVPFTRVSSVALWIHRNAPLGCMVILVSVQEACDLALGDTVSRNIKNAVLHSRS